MKPTKKQLKTFPSVINVWSTDGKEYLGEIPGNVLWDYMVENGYRSFSIKSIEKAVSEFLNDALNTVKKSKNKTTTKKYGRTKKSNKKSNN
jgi:hypothetical protein